MPKKTKKIKKNYFKIITLKKSLRDNECKQLKSIFSSFDENNDDCIDIYELQKKLNDNDIYLQDFINLFKTKKHNTKSKMKKKLKKYKLTLTRKKR